MAVTYKLLKAENPEYDDDYWTKIRILYAGGQRWKHLKDATDSVTSTLREMLFPRHLGEEDEVYNERVKRSYYIPYLGQLVDYITSVLLSDPVTMSAGGEDEDDDPGSVEPFYAEFCKNVARPGADPMSLNTLLKKSILTALLCRRSWVLVDLPKKPVDEEGNLIPIKSAKVEEAFQLDRAYCVPLEPEQVLDWECDENGALEYVNVYSCRTMRASIESGRTACVETFTVYTRTGWTRYIYEYDTKKPQGKGGPPKDNEPPKRTEQGDHSFGRVPVLSFELPEGLWAGAKLEGLATEHLNASCALSWGRYRSLFQILVATLQDPNPMNPITENANRAVDQTIGPGRIWVGGEKDRLGFIGPDAAPFKEAREALKELRDEMHRVLHQMAQSVDNSGAALQRSAQSKQVDQSTGAIVSKELGRLLREFAEMILATVTAGRKETPKDWHAQGLEEFDDITLSDFLAEATLMEGINVPSELYQVLYKFDLATRSLPGLTDDQKEIIFQELQKNITAESLAAAAMRDAAVEGVENPDGDEAPGAPAKPAAGAAAASGKGKTGKKADDAKKTDVKTARATAEGDGKPRRKKSDKPKRQAPKRTPRKKNVK